MKAASYVGSSVQTAWRRRHHASPLIGREQECEQMEAMLQEIEQYTQQSADESAFSSPPSFFEQSKLSPQCVLMTGEAGIGKTRLAEECAALAAAMGWQVFWGQGQPQMQGRPYSIFLDVLHAALSLDLIYPKLYNGPRISDKICWVGKRNADTCRNRKGSNIHQNLKRRLSRRY